MKKTKKLSVILMLFFVSSLLTAATADVSAQFKPQRLDDRKAYRATPKGFGMPIAKVIYSNGVDKGILRCQPGKMGILVNCVVKNMPLLLQTDPRLDSDVADSGPNGCFDTSLVTVILTALANRTTTQPLKGRTKEFVEVPASKTAPKEVEQLSWYYRVGKQYWADEKDKNGKRIQPLYLSEAHADLGGKIKEPCDPYTWADCKDATSQFGHTFYKYADGNENWTNEYITKKMRDGYAVLIAYERFKPSIVVEKGRKFVKFVPAGLHKVVFSGYQLGHKYPLLINDVGSGQQFRVRLGTDLFVRKFAPGNSTTAETVGETDFRYPTHIKTPTFMEYEGMANGINDQVQFIVHIDAIKLN